MLLKGAATTGTRGGGGPSGGGATGATRVNACTNDCCLELRIVTGDKPMALRCRAVARATGSGTVCDGDTSGGGGGGSVGLVGVVDLVALEC